MNAPLRLPVQFDVQGLIRAIAQNQSNDCFPLTLFPAQWEVLANYMQPFGLMQGHVLIEQNALSGSATAATSGRRQ